jgi:hypothetical protein
MGGLRSWTVVSAVLAAAAGAAGPGLLGRVTLTPPPGYTEAAGTKDTREWAPARLEPGLPERIVLLERPHESWDDANGALKRLHRLLKENCPRTNLETVPRALPVNADGATRGILYCPSHDASGRGLVVVEDVIVVGDRMIIAKLAFDFPQFSPGVKPLKRDQRELAFAALDSNALPAPPPRVLPP